MNPKPAKLSVEELHALRLLDACLVANAIETFRERLRNEGFADGSVRAMFPRLEPMVGYAATVKIRGSAPPTAAGPYPDRTDLWDYILSLPSPRVLVVQDVATRIGLGSMLGAVSMNVFHALGCVGAATNGSVRNLPVAEGLGFQLFCGNVTVSHAYVHVIEFGRPVEVAGLKINSGDLLHGDQHGFQTIPLDIAAQIPGVAAQIREKEQAIISVCRSSKFSLQNLRTAIARQKA